MTLSVPWTIIDHFLAHLRFSEVIKNIPKNATVLDLGCGDGKLLFRIKDHIYRGVGIDLKAPNRKIGKIRLIKVDIEKKIPVKDNSFDVVLAIALIEHLKRPSPIFNKIYRILKKNGKLILTTPTPRSRFLLEFMAFKLGLIAKEEIRGHTHYWNRSELVQFLKKKGFRKIAHSYFQFGFNQIIIAKK
ncbi:MAG: class I SAM-dependent methyltransferase [Candidatus Anstonellales archaeon]